jgi:endogenous inhibitor of DNA gyrase (YacG/DUF329 family)
MRLRLQGRFEAIWGGYGEKDVKRKAPQKSVNAKCSTCGAEFESKARKKTDNAFCSPRCRLLFWTAGQILMEWKAGRADGLREIIRELAAPAEEGR